MQGYYYPPQLPQFQPPDIGIKIVAIILLFASLLFGLIGILTIFILIGWIFLMISFITFVAGFICVFFI